VNDEGSLTTAGETAVGCIRNGLILGLGAVHLGVPLPLVISGLGTLAKPTGCGGIVDMSGIQSVDQFQFLTQALGLR
jgi:hypothetical protein